MNNEEEKERKEANAYLHIAVKLQKENTEIKVVSSEKRFLNLIIMWTVIARLSLYQCEQYILKEKINSKKKIEIEKSWHIFDKSK